MNGKFKVWDSKDKCFVEDEWKDSFVLNWKGELCTVSMTSFCSAGKRYSVIYSIEQTDKNEVELYEYDIIKAKSGNSQWVGYIKYAESCCAYWLENNEGSLDFLSSFSELEKIGNKFENPELLKT